MTFQESIQSISKVFTMARVVQDLGPEAIEKRIGVDATGMRFNSIVASKWRTSCWADGK